MTGRTIGVAALLAALCLSGCAQTDTGDAQAGPVSPVSSGAAEIPTATPATKPPQNPTDDLKPSSWVVGTVTKGGSGPCYGLVTDDGTQYALHNADGLKLIKGTRVRVQTERALVRINCGAGKLVTMTVAEALK